jgi:hypothetical protein
MHAQAMTSTRPWSAATGHYQSTPIAATHTRNKQIPGNTLITEIAAHVNLGRRYICRLLKAAATGDIKPGPCIIELPSIKQLTIAFHPFLHARVIEIPWNCDGGGESYCLNVSRSIYIVRQQIQACLCKSSEDDAVDLSCVGEEFGG